MEKVKPAKLTDIARKVAKKLDIPYEQGQYVVRAFMEALQELLEERGRVVLTGFCTFCLKVRPRGLYKKHIIKKGEDPDIYHPDRVVAFVSMSSKQQEKAKLMAADPAELARLIEINRVAYDKALARMETQAAKREAWRKEDAEAFRAIKVALLAKYGITEIDEADLDTSVAPELRAEIHKAIRS